MKLLQIHEPGETPLPHEDERGMAVGIDLGTTNTVIAIATDQLVAVVRDEEGRALLPSVVAYGDEVVVGEDARRILLESPETVVSSIKRLMGRGAGDLKHLAGALPYELAPAQGGGMVRLKVGGRVLSPVEISADILRAAKARAEAALGQDVDRAVITVPAYFDDAARTATRDAARLAGLDVLRLVNEPTAAALAYGLDKQSEGIYAVYDLGGGTFDFSLLRLEKGVFQVLATGGDAALGGDDFDHAIAARFFAERGTPVDSIAGEAGPRHRAAGQGMPDHAGRMERHARCRRQAEPARARPGDDGSDDRGGGRPHDRDLPRRARGRRRRADGARTAWCWSAARRGSRWSGARSPP